ncbi:MAG TPA: DUF502 domain-containing protein [Firmicutes bacterium]|nr:DUF502 domain-containing protein [Bacillota bacterium]
MKRIIAVLRTYLIAGIVTLLPFLLTVYLVYLIFAKFDIWMRRNLYIEIPGIGIILSLAVIILVGFLVKNFIGRWIIRIPEYLFLKMPLVNRIYKLTKQITSAVLGRGNYLFTGVALIEYPRKGVYSLAFITEKMDVTLGEQEGLNGKDYVAVFIPTTPNPTSGMMIFVKESELVKLNISVETGMKIVISSGIASLEDK